MEKSFIAHNPVVSSETWLNARRDLLKKEKALTRMRDQLNAERRALPWVLVEKEYIFDSPHGKKTLADLFQGRTQLFIKHFMMGPGWTEGCVGCSFGSDHIDAARIHLENHDVSVVAVSRAPLPEIEAFKRRMGWKFRWVSSYGSDFNYDFHASFTKEEVEKNEAFYNFEKRKLQGGEEASGMSVFYKDENGDVFHTYSAFARGDEEVISTYMILDLTPKGRNENSPGGNLTNWVRHHDRYQDAGFVDHTGRYHAEDQQATAASQPASAASQPVTAASQPVTAASQPATAAASQPASCCHGTETHGTQAHGAEAHRAETHGAETHGAEAHSTQAQKSSGGEL